MVSFKLDTIIKSLKSSYGEDFLNTITMQLHTAIDAQYTFIAKLDKTKNVSRTVTMVSEDGFGENFEYSLQHTPCADVSDNSTCIYPKEICSLYPQDQLLIDMGIEGYVGAPLHNSKGEVFGLVVALYTKPINSAKDIAALFELFSGRIAAEIERSEHEIALNKLNKTLESSVRYRTLELEKAMEQLKVSQKNLVEKEKLASLGELVAGVAHEINTPLSIAILSNSALKSKVHTLETKFNQRALSKRDLEEFINDSNEATNGISVNLTRSAELINNFKQVAADANTDERVIINLSQWLNSLSMSLNTLLAQSNINLILNIPNHSIVIRTLPSRLAQVLTNIITNAIIHAYPAELTFAQKELSMTLMTKNDAAIIEISDNGIGMNKETQEKIFNPFYTTNRAAGGVGLGMSIVYNLVTNSLGGTIQISSQQQGSKIIISLPKPENKKLLIVSSFERATANSYKFYHSFHARLINSNETVKAILEKTDMDHQHKMILSSMNLFVDNINCLQQFTQSEKIQKLITMHNVELSISNDLFVLWKDCFIATLNEFDNKFDDVLSQIWNESLTEFIGYFTMSDDERAKIEQFDAQI